MTKLTRDKVRQAIKSAGITTDNVTAEQLASLHSHIDKAMIESGCYNGTMRMNSGGIKDLWFMSCRTEQWKSREAVSFNCDGFIGFAGWAADDNNVQPILEGVVNWVKEMAKKWRK